MVIYYDDSTKERYREVMSLGERSSPAAGQIRIDVKTFPDCDNQKRAVWFDTETGAVVLRGDVITEKQREAMRAEVMEKGKYVMLFTPTAGHDAALTFISDKLTEITAAKNTTELLSVRTDMETKQSLVAAELSAVK